MKTRRVRIILDGDSESPLSTLRDVRSYHFLDAVDHLCKVKKAQANVIREKKDTTSRRR
jgi:hypothetical protein